MASPALPPELWCLVLGNLDAEDGATLANLSLVSKQLQAIVQPVLYRDISAKQFCHPSFAASLCSRPLGKSRGQAVREVAVELQLDVERLAKLSNGEAPSHEEIEMAQAKPRAEWARIYSILKQCPAVVKLRVKMDCPPSSDPQLNLISPESVFPHAFVPSTTDLLALPMIKTLRYFALFVPTGANLDTQSFGQLIAAAVRLETVELEQVDASRLFEPTVQQIAKGSPHPVIQHLVHSEGCVRDGRDSIRFEDYIACWVQMPSIRTFHCTCPYPEFDPEIPQWHGITSLQIQHLQPPAFDDSDTPWLEQLDIIFPSVQHLSLFLPLIIFRTPFQPILRNLKALCLGYTAPEELLQLKCQLPIMLRQLLASDFAPHLDSLYMGVADIDIDGLRPRGPDTSWVGVCVKDVCEIQSQRPLLQSVQLADGPASALLLREEDGRFSDLFEET